MYQIYSAEQQAKCIVEYLNESNCTEYNNIVVEKNGNLTAITDQTRIEWLLMGKPHYVLCHLHPCISEETFFRIGEGLQEIVDYLGLEETEVHLNALCCGCCGCCCKK